jgi:hypothetical protein
MGVVGGLVGWADSVRRLADLDAVEHGFGDARRLVDLVSGDVERG